MQAEGLSLVQHAEEVAQLIGPSVLFANYFGGKKMFFNFTSDSEYLKLSCKLFSSKCGQIFKLISTWKTKSEYLAIYRKTVVLSYFGKGVKSQNIILPL